VCFGYKDFLEFLKDAKNYLADKAFEPAEKLPEMADQLVDPVPNIQVSQ
jgi:hypothetical protein